MRILQRAEGRAVLMVHAAPVGLHQGLYSIV